ncbi:MAG: hypothetical protein J6A69_08880 [Clostridia bacterium]|nr:hypothetical protein [Clostridia bacterium]
MKYSIAGYKLELRGENSDYIAKMMHGYESDFSDADLVITYSVEDKIKFNSGSNAVAGAGKFSWQADESDSSVYAYTFSKTYNLYLAVIRWNGEFNRADIYAIDSCPLGGPSIDVKLFGLIGQAFYYMLMMHHSMVFHASAISYKKNGILFSAPSETGKSTQSHMWEQLFPDDVKFINDDNPVLKIEDDVVYVYGTPWAGKNSINNNISAKVSAIICLEQYSKIEIKKLSGLDAFFRVYNETNKPVLENMLEVLLGDVNKLIEKTDVYLMKCNLTQDTVYEVKKLLGL